MFAGSSVPSLQSVTPSQYQFSGMHWPPSHAHSPASQVAPASHSASSSPPSQSSSPSHSHHAGRQV